MRAGRPNQRGSAGAAVRAGQSSRMQSGQESFLSPDPWRLTTGQGTLEVGSGARQCGAGAGSWVDRKERMRSTWQVTCANTGEAGRGGRRWVGSFCRNTLGQRRLLRRLLAGSGDACELAVKRAHSPG